VAVKEEHLLSNVDIIDDVSIFCCDNKEAYVFAPIASIDIGFGNVTDHKDIPDLKTPIECEDEDMSESKASCASKANSLTENEDHDNDVEPSMNTSDDKEVEVDYEFHNDAAFVQIKLGLEEADVEEVLGLSEIRPTLQALNSPNMWIGDTGATKHSTKHKQRGINSRPSTSRTKGIYGQAVKPSMEVDLPGMYCDKSGEDQLAVKLQNIDIIPESQYKFDKHYEANGRRSQSIGEQEGWYHSSKRITSHKV
jgi:hypothetical protein